MRALVATLLVFACGADMGGGSMRQHGMSPHAGDAEFPGVGAAGCVAWPAGYVYLFDADDIDGDSSGNSAYVNGGLISTWANKGATSGDADVGNPSNDGTKPLFEEGAVNSRDAVAFDGVADHRVISSSAAGMKFIHETGIFDLVIVFRKDATATDSLFASSNTSTAAGFNFRTTAADKVQSLVYEGGGAINLNMTTSTATFSNGVWSWFEARGDGTTFSISKEGGTAETAAFTNKPFGTGDMAFNATIGSDQVPGNWLDGAVAVVLLYSTELSAEDRATIGTAIDCRYAL